VVFKKTWLCVIAFLVLLFLSGEPDGFGSELKQIFSKEGITVELSLEPVKKVEGGPEGLMEDEDVALSFKVMDAATGQVLPGLNPAAWIDPGEPRPGEKESTSCKDKVRWFMQGSLSFRPVIDLNTYYILTLNEKPSISVIDPLLGFYISKLITLVPLKKPGEDWVLTADGQKLFVTMPAAAEVAVVDTTNWKVAANVAAGPNPIRIALQPDGRYLWVGNDVPGSGEGKGGVTVMDPEKLEVRGRIHTGAGHHEMAFSDDNRYAFVTNREDGTVSVIDIRTLEAIKTMRTGPAPVSLDYSGLADALYVADETDGGITVIDGTSHQVLARIEAEPGLKMIRFSPDGRWGFAVNYREDLVHVVDSSVNRVLHHVKTDPKPDRVSFSPAFAYIRPAGSDHVNAIQLSLLEKELKITPLRFPAGQPAERSSHTSPADAIVPTPEGDVVLIANPEDKTVYYYMEGMLAPMGTFQNYGRVPRSVLVVDRSLKETVPGTYSSSFKLPPAGTYDVAFMIDNPLVYDCFKMTVRPNPTYAKVRGIPMVMEVVAHERSVPVGNATRVKVKLTDPATGKPLADLKDFTVLAFQTAGHWRKRSEAKPLGEGLYEAEITLPKLGYYYVFFECPSLNVRTNQLAYLVVQAK
jgi:YVTN family beta-propeller protein